VSSEERARIVELDKRYVWHPYTPMEAYLKNGRPLVIERAVGSRLFDVDGRSYIDGNASWWTSLLGHGHPRLVRALTEQANKLCHTALGGMTHAPAARFAEALARVAPRGLEHVFFSDNGSTAVESAIKLCAQFWVQNGRPEKTRFLSLEDAFHGETLGVTALGGVDAFRRPFSALTMPVTHLPSPADGIERALDALERELASHADEISALVVEPLVQGAGGMRMYGPEYLREARRLTERYDVLFVVDEVFTGYGRTGTFWACDHAGISPDVICTAKGLSGGLLPFAATLTSERVFRGFLGAADRAFYYGHTYCGNPLGAAVALEVLAVYEDEGILALARKNGERIAQAFDRLGQLPGVSASRSLGMVGALELGGSGSYLERAGWDVYERALELGAYVRPLGNVVYVTPALNISEADLSELLAIVDTAVRAVAV
jgi:adenosylmethionine---8-amino-7-oxononanoate aminotransferase